MPTYYHASPAKFTTITRELCLTDTPEEAVPYLEGRPGWLYTIEARGRIAYESTLTDIGTDLGVEYDYAFEYADSKKVQDALIADGYEIVEYEDMGPDNAYEHNTYRVLNPSAARIVSLEPVGKLAAVIAGLDAVLR